jgi:hypothetical protein
VQHGWSLENVDEQHRLHPRTYSIPRSEVRDALAPGQLVKLAFLSESPDGQWSGERMWVEIVAVESGRYLGKLDNQPRYLGTLQIGDSVQFGPEHVAAIHVLPDQAGWFDADWLAVVSRVVYEDGAFPGRLYRAEPEREDDSGWRLSAGDEPEAFFDDDSSMRACPLAELVERFPVLDSVLGAEIGSAWSWSEELAEYRRR